MSTNIIDQLRERGLVRQTVYEDELKQLLDSGSQSFYIGFDPTADSADCLRWGRNRCKKTENRC